VDIETLNRVPDDIPLMLKLLAHSSFILSPVTRLTVDYARVINYVDIAVLGRLEPGHRDVYKHQYYPR
jgi:hypothetical protein